MSEFSRETLLNIIETDHVQCGEASALARMALAAMDSSESVELPLDYLQGHKDGLEWAARLAEANHPDTGDWLYDDPIELAKAIRKGPDMPPVQPVADSEPDRNPVLAYADSYRDMAKQGVESVPIWSVITDLERNIAPLYRHAQPAPVVPDEKDKTVDADDHPLLWSFNEGWNACRAAMLQELKKVQELKRSAGVTKMCRCCMPNLRRNPIAVRRKTASIRSKKPHSGARRKPSSHSGWLRDGAGGADREHGHRWV